MEIAGWKEESKFVLDLGRRPTKATIKAAKQSARERRKQLRKKGDPEYVYIKINGAIVWGCCGFIKEATGANRVEVNRNLGATDPVLHGISRNAAPRTKIIKAAAIVLDRYVKGKEPKWAVEAILKDHGFSKQAHIELAFKAAEYTKLGVNPVRALRLARNAA